MRLFFSYASEDHPAVCDAYVALREAGLRPWMDKPPTPFERDGLKAGFDWEPQLLAAMDAADFFVPFVSRALADTCLNDLRYAPKEIQAALARPKFRRSGYLIPVRLENCEPPDVSVDEYSLRDIQCFDLYKFGHRPFVEIIRSYGAAAVERPQTVDLVTLVRTARQMHDTASAQIIERMRLGAPSSGHERLGIQIGGTGDRSERSDAVPPMSPVVRPPAASAVENAPLGGEWLGRWNKEGSGMWVPSYDALIRSVGPRVYISYQDHQGRFLVDLFREHDWLVGRYFKLGNPGDNGVYVGRIADADWIQGAWGGQGDAGRMDFLRHRT